MLMAFSEAVGLVQWNTNVIGSLPKESKPVVKNVLLGDRCLQFLQRILKKNTSISEVLLVHGLHDDTDHYAKGCRSSLPSVGSYSIMRRYFTSAVMSVGIGGCIHKFTDWPPGERTANSTALCP
jgi:hypothetical protein